MRNSQKESDAWSEPMFWVTVGSIFVLIGFQLFDSSQATYYSTEELMSNGINTAPNLFNCSNETFYSQKAFLGRVTVFDRCIKNNQGEIHLKYDYQLSNLLSAYLLPGWIFLTIGLMFLGKGFGAMPLVKKNEAHTATVKAIDYLQFRDGDLIYLMAFVAAILGFVIVLKSFELVIFFSLIMTISLVNRIDKFCNYLIELIILDAISLFIILILGLYLFGVGASALVPILGLWIGLAMTLLSLTQSPLRKHLVSLSKSYLKLPLRSFVWSLIILTVLGTWINNSELVMLNDAMPILNAHSSLLLITELIITMFMVVILLPRMMRPSTSSR